MSDNVVPDGKIRDYIDGKLRNDTPEEYVRQTVERRLVHEHKYLREQVKVEYTLRVGSGRPRADLVLWDKDAEQTQDTAKIIIECKKESVDANKSKDGIGQLKSYMSVCPNCEWGMWTNSRQKYVFRKVHDDNGSVSFEEYNDIPPASGDLESIDRPKRGELRMACDDNLLYVFRTCHDYIFANAGMHKQESFFELLKLIFCKTQDERNALHPLEFYATSRERGNSDGQLTVKKRISAIFEEVKRQYPAIFDKNDELELPPRALAKVVSELQGYSLLDTDIDVKGKAYEEVVGANLRGDRGEFFTPRNVMRMVVEMLDPKENERVLDSSCGTGGFVVAAMLHVIGGMERAMTKQLGRPKEQWSLNEYQLYRDRVRQLAARDFFGFDIGRALARATKMNMVMNGDGAGHVMQVDSLLPPHEWTADFKRYLAEALGVEPDSFVNGNNLAHFDVIVTNPPFGSKIPIDDETVLRQYEIAHIWQQGADGKWKMTNKLQTSVPPERLFIERCTQFLKEGGRMGIVLPDSILGNPGLEYLRAWILDRHHVLASIDLHADTFQPHNGTQTSVLIVQKKTQQERYESAPPRNIFMAMVERIGHDKRGNPTFVRDEDGNLVMERDSSDAAPHTVSDDQTGEVPKLFAEWKLDEGVPW